MSIRYIKKNSGGGTEENIFWVTMADLLLGLAIIFITLFVLAMTGFSQQDIQQQKVKMEVSEKISGELKKANIAADIDKMTGDLKIDAVELFELNSYVLSDNGKALLDKSMMVAVGLNTYHRGAAAGKHLKRYAAGT